MISPVPMLRALRSVIAVLALVVLAVALLLPSVLARSSSDAGLAAAAAAATPEADRAAAKAPAACDTSGNAIACENSKPGALRWDWDVRGAGDASIQGFATDASVNVGGRIEFKVTTDAAAYSIDVFRTGWYEGLGARKIASVPVAVGLPQVQPACASDAATGLVDCGNWAVSASWDVPADAVSGVYVARLRRSDTGGASHITFVVRNDASHSDLVFQTSDTTWQAYNGYGGTSLYGAATSHAVKVSFNRPVTNRDGAEARNSFRGSEFPMVRFLERNGYDVTYQSGVDTDRSGALLKNHKVFLSVGHDEYWSGPQRANVEAARDAGVNLAFFSGNEVYWRTRYEGSTVGDRAADRTLVTYKETSSYGKTDPSPEWTGTWRDPRFASTSAGAGRPENALAGSLFMANDTDLPVTVTSVEGAFRLWRNTSLAGMPERSATELAAHTVGYESDEDLDNGARPPGLIRLSTTLGPTPHYVREFGAITVPGSTQHHLTMYRAASGALVFSAGTINWSWGLDDVHDGVGVLADIRMQQATVNLLADMGAQAGSLMPELIGATPSTDSTPPTVRITSPLAGEATPNGSYATVAGTAADLGGRVAGVEVSTDGGVTWHPATGTTSWSYRYVSTGVGVVAILARATDDSANLGAPSVRNVGVTCPCSVLGAAVPTTPATNDPAAQELGLRVTPVVAGFVTGMRFYKGAGNDGPHVGTLWSTAGVPLARVQFTGETPNGWQTASFGAPVAVAAGQTVVVSYTATQGHYAADIDAFASAGLSAPPLTVAGGYGADSGGVFGDPGTFPGSRYSQSNYFVDLAFVPVP